MAGRRGTALGRGIVEGRIRGRRVVHVRVRRDGRDKVFRP